MQNVVGCLAKGNQDHRHSGLLSPGGLGLSFHVPLQLCGLFVNRLSPTTFPAYGSARRCCGCLKSRCEALVNRLRLTSWLAEQEPMTSKERPLLKLLHGASGVSICHGLDPRGRTGRTASAHRRPRKPCGLRSPESPAIASEPTSRLRLLCRALPISFPTLYRTSFSQSPVALLDTPISMSSCHISKLDFDITLLAPVVMLACKRWLCVMDDGFTVPAAGMRLEARPRSVPCGHGVSVLVTSLRLESLVPVSPPPADVRWCCSSLGECPLLVSNRPLVLL